MTNDKGNELCTASRSRRKTKPKPKMKTTTKTTMVPRYSYQ